MNKNGDCKWSFADQAYADMANDCTGDGTTTMSCSITGLSEGANTLYISCRDTLGNQDTAGTNTSLSLVVDTTPPVKSSWSPAKGSVIATTSPAMTFNTTENADCRWSLADQAYGAMAGDCTGDGTTSQGCSASGLSEGLNTVYIVCQDSFGNMDTAGTNEHVQYTVDTTMPVQSLWNPAKDSVIVSTSPTVTLNTNENADCKWSLSNQDYVVMAGDCTGDGTTSQACAVTGLSVGGNTVYIACNDTVGNSNTSANTEHVSYTVDTVPPGQNSWMPANGSTISTIAPVVTFNTSENGDCKWSLSDQAYAAMAGDCTGDGATNQSCSTAGLAQGVNTVYIACRDSCGNQDSAGTNQHLSYTVDIAPPTRNTFNPTSGATLSNTSPAVTFALNENGDCKWSLADQAYGAMAGDCNGDGATSQSCDIAGLSEGPNTVYIACKDSYGNQDSAGTNEHLSYIVDTMPPVGSAFNPASGAAFAITSPTVTFTLNKPGDCKWSLSDQAYGAMAGDCTGDGTMSQNCAVSGLPQGAITVYIACNDIAGNQDTALSNQHLNFTVDSMPPVFAGAQSAGGCGSGCLEPAWSAVSDAGGSLPITYNIYIATATGAENFASSSYQTASTSYALHGLTGCQRYYFVVRAADSLGNEEANTNEISGMPITDLTPPNPIMQVNDGADADIDFSSSAISLPFNWTASSDPETGVAAYWFAIGTAAGATDVMGWTNNGTNTSAAPTGLNLTDGVKYYVSVMAENNVGLENAVTVSNGVTVDISAPVVSIIAPATGSSVSGAATVMGAVSDVSLASWSLLYGTGTSPSAWREIANGTIPVNNAALGLWDVGTLAGAYTLKLVASDFFGRTTQASVQVTANNMATVSGNIPKFKWMLVAAPAEPVNPGILDMFGSAGIYKIYRADPTSANDPYLGYYKAPAQIHAGYGYWIKSYYNDLPYFYGGTLVDTTQDYALPVKAGWNQIGSPFNRAFPWSQVRVRYQGNIYDLATAAGMGLLSQWLYAYDNMANSWVQRGPDANVEKETGYSLLANHDLELLFGPGAGMAGGMARVVRQVWDYNIRISASAGESSDTDNFIGSANTAKSGFDILDAPEPPRTPEDKFISLYFPRDDWNQVNSARFAGDIRGLSGKAGGVDSWTFNVDTNEAGQPVTISWDKTKLPADRFKFSLTNLDNNQKLDMAAAGGCVYIAAPTGESTVHFRIDVEKLREEAVTEKLTIDSPGWQLISLPLEPEATSAPDVFGKIAASNIYQFYDGKFFSQADADIQTGYSYWVYADAPTTVDVKGVPVNGDVTVHLKTGWNMIGNPFNSTTSWADSNMSLTCSGSILSLSQAISTGKIMPNLYEFDGNNYKESKSMEPWLGYFVKAREECDLIMNR